MSDLSTIQDQLNKAGFDNAVAVATPEEVAAGAACGQLALIVNDKENTDVQ